MECIEQLAVRFGIERAEAADIMEQVHIQREKLEAKMADNADLDAKLRENVDNLAAREYSLALANKRALQLSYAKRMELFNLAVESFKGKEWEAFPAILGGSQRALPGSRRSVDAGQSALRGYYLGGFISDLEALGDGNGSYLKLLNRGIFDADIVNALWSLDNPAAPGYQGPKEALEVAQVIHKWQEKARYDANRAGAWIGKEPGYVVRQSHDRSKMRRAGEVKWTEDVMGLLDWDRTGDGSLLTDKARRDFLHEAYANLTLARLRKQGGNELSVPASRIGARAARMSQERVLHFRDGAAWFRYNKEYGRGNVREAMIDGLSSMANNTALMRVLGPNPHGTMDAAMRMLEEVYRNAGDQRGIDSLNGVREHTSHIMKEVDGTLNAEAADHPTLAAVGRVTRALNSVTRLGGALLSSFSDAPNFAEEMAYQGHGYFSALLGGMKLAAQGRGTRAQRRIMSSMGVFADSMAGDIVARVSGDDGPGAMSRMQTWFFKLNGLSWWTDSWRKATGLMMAHDLALDSGTAWSGLSRQKRRLMEMYGIGEAEWGLMRRGNLTAADGRKYFTPDALDGVDDAEIAAYLRGRGVDDAALTALRIADTREDLADRLRVMLRDRINYAVLEPDAKTRAYMRQGISAGTWAGEALRWALQFKSFSFAFTQRTLGRLAKGRAGDSGLETGMAIARLLIMTTAFGYMSMAAKDLAKGRTPRDWKDPKTWLAAFTQGGGAGFYGDFILGDYNRFGGGFAESVAGPTVGNIGDLARIWTQMREGDSFGQGLARWIQNNIPGNSLFYVRSAMDYLIMYNLYDWMKPGYFRRMKKRVERENNQTFFMRPIKWW